MAVRLGLTLALAGKGKPVQVPAIHTAFVNDLKECAVVMKESKMLNLDMTYQAFHAHTSNVVAEKARGKYCKKGNNVYYSLLGNTFILEKDLLLVRDDTGKVVLIKKNNGYFDPVKQHFDPGTVAHFAKKITRTEGNNGLRTYDVELKDTEVGRMLVAVDTAKYLISSIELLYNREVELIEKSGIRHKIRPRVKIVYQFNKAEPEEGLFSASKLLIKKGKQWALAQSLSAYEFIDQYNTVKK